MSVAYTPAPEVEKIAEGLIRKHHAHLEHVEIRYVFRSEAAKEAGRTIYGKARKVGGLNAALLAMAEQGEEVVDEDDHTIFVIEIARPVWNVLSKEQRVALVDHELCHCRTKFSDEGDLRLVIVPHDVEAFCAEVDRHGLWKSDIEVFVKVANQQLSLLAGEAS